VRTHGTLTKWNDDRGFGFITAAKGDRDIFVHISEFPRDGVRPRLNELVSFEIETTKEGKQRAVRVMRPKQRTSDRAAPGKDSGRRAGGWLEGAITLAAVAAIGLYGYQQYQTREAARDRPAVEPVYAAEAGDSRYVCDGRTHCSQMQSCEEATWFIRHCPNTQMDGNADGEPCETQWCQ